jgi:hypothetical protein
LSFTSTSPARLNPGRRHEGIGQKPHSRSVSQAGFSIHCPLDCVSHDAADRIKRFCERHTKLLVFLPRASLAAFNRGLNTVAS